MTIDQNIPLDKQLFHSRLSPVHTDHSTPSIAPNCGYQTSDCYGFDDMPSPLPFSPVGQPVLPPSFVPSSPGSVSVTSSITSISPGKRKADPRIFDVPIERPSKKMKKKKTKLLVSILLIISNIIGDPTRQMSVRWQTGSDMTLWYWWRKPSELKLTNQWRFSMFCTLIDTIV